MRADGVGAAFFSDERRAQPGKNAFPSRRFAGKCLTMMPRLCCFLTEAPRHQADGPGLEFLVEGFIATRNLEQASPATRAVASKRNPCSQNSALSAILPP